MRSENAPMTGSRSADDVLAILHLYGDWWDVSAQALEVKAYTTVEIIDGLKRKYLSFKKELLKSLYNDLYFSPPE